MLQNDIVNLSKLKSQVKSLTDQLTQVCGQLKRAACEKECLYKKNEELTQEANSLYNALNDLSNEYTYKTESVLVELDDTKQCRDALCHEGRHVIRNVRSWITEQQTINKKLKNELRTKKATIAKLKKENQ